MISRSFDLIGTNPIIICKINREICGHLPSTQGKTLFYYQGYTTYHFPQHGSHVWDGANVHNNGDGGGCTPNQYSLTFRRQNFTQNKTIIRQNCGTWILFLNFHTRHMAHVFISLYGRGFKYNNF